MKVQELIDILSKIENKDAKLLIQESVNNWENVLIVVDPNDAEDYLEISIGEI